MTDLNGVVIVDKESGITSHQVVGKLRRLLGTRKIGHAGTLDPMATGVMILGVNRATRLLGHLALHDKRYLATVRLGESSPTDDADGDVETVADASSVTMAQVEQGLAPLRGDILQVPSSVSAIKVDGKRSYARVRAGESVELKARPVTVSRLDVLGVRVEGARLDVDLDVECSSGTYIRAIARDLGSALGVGGHLTALRRTRVGDLTLDRTVSLDQLDPEHGPGPAAYLVDLPSAARAALTSRELDEDEARALGYGQRIDSEVPGRTAPVAAFGPDGRLVAILDESGRRARAHVVLAPAGQK